MNLDELIRDLALVELSGLSMAGHGSIDEERLPAVVVAANDGLLRLHTRFPILQKNALIQMYEHITNYYLLPKYSLQGHDPRVTKYPYILDLPEEPFEDDCIKVLEVFDSYGRHLPINDMNSTLAIFVPKPKMIQVPRPLTSQSLSVTYQAIPKLLNPEDLETDIGLPLPLIGALKEYIAFKMKKAIDTPEMQASAAQHMEAYDAICTEADQGDTVTTTVSNTNTQFERMGWI